MRWVSSVIRRFKRIQYHRSLVRHVKKGTPITNWEKFPVTVHKRDSFHGIFSPGERVLELHFAGGRGMARGLREAMESIPRVQGEGFVGYFGDTPTIPLIRYWEKHGARIVDSPPTVQRVVKKYYRAMVAKGIFPAEYSNAPVKRIIFSFTKK